MKEIGSVPIDLLHVNPNYEEFFPPLKISEYTDLKEGISEVGIINNLVVEKDETGYVILSGHHRKKIAVELGMREILCSLAETPEEKVNALLDNSQRRQLTEPQRKEYIKKKKFILKDFYQRAVIPEIYELYIQNKIDKKVIQTFAIADLETQKSTLATVLTNLKGGVPKAVLEKHEKEINDIQTQHKTDIETLVSQYAESIRTLEGSLHAAENDLNIASTEKKTTLKDLQEKTHQLIKLQNKIDEKEALLVDKKDKVAEVVREEYKAQIELLEKERDAKDQARKDVEKKVEELTKQIESINNSIHGIKTEAALWKLEAAKFSENYNKGIQYFSNPALIEVQLQVISEYIEQVVRWSKINKWDIDAIKMVEKYNKSIGEQMIRLVNEVTTNQKETLSVEEAGQNVDQTMKEGRTLIRAVQK